MGLTEQRYKVVREKLDNLGYRQPLALESLLLVEHLVADLLHTKENQQHYKALAQQSLERCSELHSGVEPFKQENDRLVQECNKLRRSLSDEREANEKFCKELKSHIRCLENNNSDLEFVCSQHLERINVLSRQLADKGHKLLALKGLSKPSSVSKTSVITKHVPRRTISSSCVSAKREKRSPVRICSARPFGGSCATSVLQPSSILSSVPDVCSLSRKKLDSLLKELEGLKQEKLDYIEEIASVQNKVAARNLEIERLHRMLEGLQVPQMPMLGDCYCATSHKECCCNSNRAQSGYTGTAESQLREQLKECQELQHEAMCRAVKLAERNAELEDELNKKKERVAKCDCLVRDGGGSDAMRKLQEKLDCRALQVEELEGRLRELEKAKKSLEADKGSVDHVLENVVEERKKLSDRVQQLSIIEHDLLAEIERLAEVNKHQHARLADLESRLLIAEKRLAAPSSMNGSSQVAGSTQNLKKTTSKVQAKAAGASKTKPAAASPKKTKKTGGKAKEDSTDQSGSSGGSSGSIDSKGKEERAAKLQSKSSRGSQTIKSKRSPTRSPETSKDMSKDDVLRRERNLLDEERKKFEETIRNLTDKQTELIHKLDEASASGVGNAPPDQVGPSAGTSSTDRDLLGKLERVQAERDYYHKEFTKLKEQISIAVGSQMCDPGSRVQSPSGILERVVTERNFFQKEFSRLQEQVNNGDKGDSGELRSKLNEKEHEVVALKEKIRDLKNLPQDPSTSGIIMRLEMERDAARGDCARLEEDRNAIKEKLKAVTESNKAEFNRLENSRRALESSVTQMEVERRDLLNNLGSSKGKIKLLEEKLEDYRDQFHGLQNDMAQQRSHLNHVQMLQDQTDRALSTSQDMLTQTETELASALERIHDLEQVRLSLEREITSLRNERVSIKANMTQLDEEKDKLLLKVDEKTEQVVRLERELKLRDNRVTQLEGVVAELQRKLDSALDTISHTEQNTRHIAKEVDRYRQELTSLEHAKDNAIRENKRLQDDLAAMTHDHISSTRALETAKREVEDLKMQLQGYVTEVRHIEDILEQKESERTGMLDQFRSLSMEATALESNNHTLESEAKSNKSLLRAAEQELRDLQAKLEDKDAFILGYEKQMTELTANVAGLEMQLAKQGEQKQRLENDLVNARDVCCKLDKQKESLIQQVTEHEMNKLKMEKEFYRIQAKHDDIEEELTRERRNSATLENVLASTRQETLEKKMSNKELRKQVELLHSKVMELQKKLEHGNDALRQCQTETAEYQQQVSELRREVTNERFERACAEERSGQSLSSTSPT